MNGYAVKDKKKFDNIESPIVGQYLCYLLVVVYSQALQEMGIFG